MAYNYGYGYGFNGYMAGQDHHFFRCANCGTMRPNIHNQYFGGTHQFFGGGRNGFDDEFDQTLVRQYPFMQCHFCPYDPVPQNDIRDNDQIQNSPAANSNLPLSDSETEQLVFVEKFDANSKREEETKESSSSAKSGEESKKSCSICLEEILDGDMQGKIGCCHEFHAVCIKEWLKTSPTCPQCRYNVREGAVTSK